jgi:hypothetical protein
LLNHIKGKALYNEGALERAPEMTPNRQV